MGRFHSLRRTLGVRLASSALFAAIAAALAHAASPTPGIIVEQDPHVGSGPSLGRPRAGVHLNGAAISATTINTLEGTTIVVSAGRWSAQRVHDMLLQNGLGPALGAHLTVRVGTAYPPTRITWTSTIDRSSGRSLRSPTLWLDAWAGSDFTRAPDRTIARALGRLWI